jgi:excisionase family DNA binding protein
MHPDSETYTAAEIAARLRVTERTVLRHAAAGTLGFPCVRVGRCVRFPRAAADAILGTLNLPGERGLTVSRAGVEVQVRG